ncbi:hypothetical protein KC338_g207 [Hortaea werneckii]|nr:hypothetical protein KC338_g207 [Hortaea werneckii]
MVAFLFKIADFELAVFMGVDMWTRLIKSIGRLSCCLFRRRQFSNLLHRHLDILHTHRLHPARVLVNNARLPIFTIDQILAAGLLKLSTGGFGSSGALPEDREQLKARRTFRRGVSFCCMAVLRSLRSLSRSGGAGRLVEEGAVA